MTQQTKPGNLSLAPLCVVVGLALLAWVQAVRADDKATRALDGVWIPIEASLGGQAFPQEVLKSMQLTLDNGKYTLTIGDRRDEGAYTVDTSKKPWSIDVTGDKGPNKGKTYQAIYEIQNGQLSICYDLSAKSRPKEFRSTADTEEFLVRYKRSRQID